MNAGQPAGAVREEHDSLGSVAVPVDALWGAQSQRSLDNFAIGEQHFPTDFIHCFALVKKACALANFKLGELDSERCGWIVAACDEILEGRHDDQFPLSVWQTGSGTQTNMNLNEVIANRANELAGGTRGVFDPVHPNDHVNRSQSSNDVFPTVMHVATAQRFRQRLLPALDGLIEALLRKSDAFADLIKSARTHLMDATPITLGQEFSGYVAQLRYARGALLDALPAVHRLALGGSAVGTGLNTPEGWAEVVVAQIAELAALPCVPAANKFMALAAHDALVDLHGRLKLLATALFKIGSDLRLMASGPRCGLAELELPANEPGSSIMPGKVNPTQIEALTMVAAQVFGNDAAVGFAGSQGHLELNVFKPLITHNVLESIGLLADAMASFNMHCVRGIKARPAQLTAYLERSLMLVTALSPVIGYDKAAEIAKKAYAEDLSLREANARLGYLGEREFAVLIEAASRAPTLIE